MLEILGHAPLNLIRQRVMTIAWAVPTAPKITPLLLRWQPRLSVLIITKGCDDSSLAMVTGNLIQNMTFSSKFLH